MWQDILCVCTRKVYLSARQTGQLRENFRCGSICGFGKVASLEQGSVQSCSTEHRQRERRSDLSFASRLPSWCFCLRRRPGADISRRRLLSEVSSSLRASKSRSIQSFFKKPRPQVEKLRKECLVPGVLEESCALDTGIFVALLQIFLHSHT